MSSRSRRQRQRRKAQVRQRSLQARANESARINPNIRSYDENTLNKLTTKQLHYVARGLSKDFDHAQNVAKKEALNQFYNVPKINITKRDIMYAARPEVTDQQIASAPSKRRKLLRQQQKRHNAAVQKIERANDYNSRLVDRNIKMQRYIESHGLDVAESGLSESVLQGSTLNNSIIRSKNVLKDENFLKKMSRGELIREITDVAEKVGKPAKKERRKKKSYKNVGKQKGWKALSRKEKDDFIIYRKLRGAFGIKFANDYMRLSKRDRYLLHNSTNFDRILQRAVKSPPKIVQGKSKKPTFIFANDSSSDKGEVRQQLIDFMDMVRKYD